jgi:hypothetical protein
MNVCPLGRARQTARERHARLQAAGIFVFGNPSPTLIARLIAD